MAWNLDALAMVTTVSASRIEPTTGLLLTWLGSSLMMVVVIMMVMMMMQCMNTNSLHGRLLRCLLPRRPVVP